jgi:hypothetical protein
MRLLPGRGLTAFLFPGSLHLEWGEEIEHLGVQQCGERKIGENREKKKGGIWISREGGNTVFIAR